MSKEGFVLSIKVVFCTPSSAALDMDDYGVDYLPSTLSGLLDVQVHPYILIYCIKVSRSRRSSGARVNNSENTVISKNYV